MKRLYIALAQCDFTLGAFEQNKKKIIQNFQEASRNKADLVVFSELCITGYPTEDLILRKGFQQESNKTLEEIVKASEGIDTAMIVGAPIVDGGKLYNAALLIENGKILETVYKHDLPNYGVFDEKRVFDTGPVPRSISWRGMNLGLMICEDMWNNDLTESFHDAELLISINGSPFEVGKHAKRLERASIQSRALKLPLIYVNQMCGLDDLVFDGDSFVINENQEMIIRLSRSKEQLVYTNWEKESNNWSCEPGEMNLYQSEEEVIYMAMITGLRHYVQKNGFKSVAIGLSGGIDSAITAAVAVDALGPEKVRAVMMPSRYTSEESIEDARKMAKRLGLNYHELSIESSFETFKDELKDLFEGKEEDITEENLQSRTRGTLLMAISNKFGDLVLATGNKSEMAVGYSTLYGDMCGGYSVIKDVYKTQVYKLSHWRNQHIPENALGPKGEVIPERIILKAPTAELRENQKDEDSLPPYDVLDMILNHFIEQEWSLDKIMSQGFDAETIEKVVNLVYTAEYKRRQSPPGVKISVKPFGRDRRYPITNWYRGLDNLKDAN